MKNKSIIKFIAVGMAMIGLSNIVPTTSVQAYSLNEPVPATSYSNELEKGATSYRYKYVSHTKTESQQKYLYTETATSTVKFQPTVSVNGISLSLGEASHSKSRQFKVYSVKYSVTTKMAVYHPLGHFMNYETKTVYITEKKYVGI